MNTTAASFSSLSSEHALLNRARRGSRETHYAAGRHYVLASESPLNSDQDSDSVLSIQAKETDYVQDTSDTASYCSDDYLEYEPDSDCGERPSSVATDSSSSVICTRVVCVRTADDRSLEADGEQSESSDAELGPPDYWNCLRCRARNNNPLYRYCETCFQVRKSWFPPRPKRKSRLETRREPTVECSRDPTPLPSLPPLPSLSSLSQTDSGIESTSNSQELCPTPFPEVPSLISLARQALSRAPSPGNRVSSPSNSVSSLGNNVPSPGNGVRVACTETEKAGSKRRLERENKSAKRRRRCSESESNGAAVVAPRALAASLAEADGALCITCCAKPKSGVFVHGRIAHICCCYSCAERVWHTHRRCPVCNSRVSNILKAVVM